MGTGAEKQVVRPAHGSGLGKSPTVRRGDN